MLHLPSSGIDALHIAQMCVLCIDHALVLRSLPVEGGLAVLECHGLFRFGGLLDFVLSIGRRFRDEVFEELEIVDTSHGFRFERVSVP